MGPSDMRRQDHRRDHRRAQTAGGGLSDRRADAGRGAAPMETGKGFPRLRPELEAALDEILTNLRLRRIGRNAAVEEIMRKVGHSRTQAVAEVEGFLSY